MKKGLVLVIKEDQTELEWESELNQALKIAEERCRQNGCRAPWGCSWFEERLGCVTNLLHPSAFATHNIIVK